MARRLATLLILPALLAVLSATLVLRADKLPTEGVKRMTAFTLTDPRDQTPQPTQGDLALALDEVLAGKAVSRRSTPVSGCLISRTPKPKPEGTVTYSKHVARILQKNCQECHRPGAIGPMSLLTYDDAL